jgi:LmbE family N-acetylglucosaminyl deacetylase
MRSVCKSFRWMWRCPFSACKIPEAGISRAVTLMSFERFKPTLRAAREVGMRSVERVWEFGFGTLGKLEEPGFEALLAGKGERVLVIAPHPDDEVIGCAGVIAQHVRAGDHVTVAFVTDGRRSRAMGLAPEAMAERRHLEATAAMRVLEIMDWEWLGLCEGEWDAELGESRLRPLFVRAHPEIIYAPSRVDFHPEHLRVSQIVAQSVEPNVCVRVYPVQVPLTPILANCIAPVGAFTETIQRALSSYASQRVSTASALRLRHYAARRYGIPDLAEEFWQMSGATYTRLHTQPLQSSPGEYYGLRYMPFTDPVAYIQGRAARRELATYARETR